MPRNPRIVKLFRTMLLTLDEDQLRALCLDLLCAGWNGEIRMGPPIEPVSLN